MQKHNAKPTPLIEEAAWERWILSLDKYIDPSDQPKKRLYALIVGLVLCPLIFLLLIFVGLSKELILALLVGLWIIEPVLGAFDEAGWRSERWLKYIGEKYEREKHLSFLDRNRGKKLHSYCDCRNLRPFPEKGWLKSRFLEHYICTVYEIRSAIWVGWGIAMASLLILNWLLTFLGN